MDISEADVPSNLIIFGETILYFDNYLKKEQRITGHWVVSLLGRYLCLTGFRLIMTRTTKLETEQSIGTYFRN